MEEFQAKEDDDTKDESEDDDEETTDDEEDYDADEEGPSPSRELPTRLVRAMSKQSDWATAHS
jgi:hypothetical protein